MDQATTPPAGGSPGPAPSAAPSPGGGSVQPPAWLPQNFWDQSSGAIKPEFAQHYAEASSTHSALKALEGRSADDIKFEIKLPDTVKVPDGMKVEIDPNDPRVPMVRDLALQHKLPQAAVDALVAIDAQTKIEAHNAEVARVAAEDKLLGEKGDERKGAIGAWAKGLLERKEISESEYEELRLTGTTAAGVTLLEKLIAKSNGAVPGVGGNPPPPQQQDNRTIEQRWYSGGSNRR